MRPATLSNATAARRIGPAGPHADANRALCAAWLDWLANQGRSPRTVYQYASKMDVLCDWIGARAVADLSLADLEDFLNRPRQRRAKGKQGSAATKAGDIAVLGGFWRWATARGHLVYNPIIDLEKPKVHNANPKAIEPDLWGKVWAAELDDAERVMLGLGHFFGLRREEMCALGPQHFDVGTGRIVNFKRKGDINSKETGVFPYLSCLRLFAEKRPELLGVPEDFLLPLQRLLCGDREYLLPWGSRAAVDLRRRPAELCAPLGMTTPDQINRAVARILVRIGQPDAFTPHALRHSFVTRMLEMGVPLQDVSRLSNHSSVAITMRYFRVADDPLARFLGQGSLKSLDYR